MDWKKKYDTIKPGDKVKLVDKHCMILADGTMSDTCTLWVGSIYTVYSIVNYKGNDCLTFKVVGTEDCTYLSNCFEKVI